MEQAAYDRASFFSILWISVVTALLSEAANWVLIYRKPSFKSLCLNIEKEQEKLDKWKIDNLDGSASKNKDKKIKNKDQRMKELHRELAMIKMTSSVVMAVSMIGVFSYMSSMFDTIVVAKLPFIPFGFFTALSHRNIAGTDLTDCSYVFLYAMSSMALKANLTKALGFTTPTPPAGQNPFFDMPDPDDDRAWGR